MGLCEVNSFELETLQLLLCSDQNSLEFALACGRLCSENLISFRLAETAPDAVWLADLEGVSAALHQDWAGAADGLRAGFAEATCASALAFGVEECCGVLPAARAVQLPIPQIRIGPGQVVDVRHRN